MLLWTYPITLYIGYVASSLFSAIRARSAIFPHESKRSRRINMYFFGLHCAIIITLLGTIGITMCILARKNYVDEWDSKNYLSSNIAVGLFYLAGLLPDADMPYSVTLVHFHMWLISLAYESASLHQSIGLRSRKQDSHVLWYISVITFGSLRILLLLLEIALYWITAPELYNENRSFPDESDSLLAHSSRNYTGNSRPMKSTASDGHRKGVDAQTTTWLDYLLGFRKLIPFLWPSDSKPLQVRAVFCFFLLIAQRIINILVPHQIGAVVASLGPGKIPYREILLYILFRGLQGQQGVIGSIRAILWIPISQSTYRRLSSAAFAHVLRLSLDFHISKRIGEVMSALSKGGSLNTFLDGFAFQLFPMVADLWIAAAYFFLIFDAFYALMVIAVTWIYLYVTIYMAKFRGRARREMVRRDREMDAAKTDALLSYETVHHSGAVPMEISRYEGFISHFQAAEYNVFFSLNLLNAVQNGVFTLGTLLVCYLNAYQISIDLREVAMFVTLLTYLSQLQAPLNFFGSFYTQVQNNLVDAERMLELFEEESTVADRLGAVDVNSHGGKICFSNVSFAYGDRKPALQNVSFEVLPGTSTAIVGESGSGKSTIIKLIFRFYDANQGKITLDDIDIRNIRIESLRSHIGVVPQDTILFNDTIMYNIRYARPEASEREVHDACRYASIHEKILGFPEGYSTIVGERGLKISGGERQRVAIARAFLKSPRVLLLDEATSSLDSETEGQIQGSLEKISEGRTTITIAHRLSTITKANMILVLQGGQIVERGNHVDLLTRNGLYAQMWNKQTEAEVSDNR
ncbi:ABC heavy metal transporter [Daldinia decipiens]|uniref:ABC heavy metal transporter n=1 Tax=Daldinia decipiens TaxID=326647 RepID=UPI0020C4A7C4|nr:ABC heavy metal transporter [Daldinia decipiens]KAI1662259.1 ABC heavy metal transporter [Daldinia decipiens]